MKTLLSGIPNMLAPDVPDGKDETENVELRRWGTPRDFTKEGFEPKQHFEIGEALGLMDFEAAAKISGARFTVLKGGLARLERALGQFMLDVQTGEHGYTEVNLPILGARRGNVRHSSNAKVLLRSICCFSDCSPRGFVMGSSERDRYHI